MAYFGELGSMVRLMPTPPTHSYPVTDVAPDKIQVGDNQETIVQRRNGEIDSVTGFFIRGTWDNNHPYSVAVWWTRPNPVSYHRWNTKERVDVVRPVPLTNDELHPRDPIGDFMHQQEIAARQQQPERDYVLWCAGQPPTEKQVPDNVFVRVLYESMVPRNERGFDMSYSPRRRHNELLLSGQAIRASWGSRGLLAWEVPLGCPLEPKPDNKPKRGSLDPIRKATGKQ